MESSRSTGMKWTSFTPARNKRYGQEWRGPPRGGKGKPFHPLFSQLPFTRRIQSFLSSYVSAPAHSSIVGVFVRSSKSSSVNARDRCEQLFFELQFILTPIREGKWGPTMDIDDIVQSSGKGTKTASFFRVPSSNLERQWRRIPIRTVILIDNSCLCQV